MGQNRIRKSTGHNLEAEEQRLTGFRETFGDAVEGKSQDLRRVQSLDDEILSLGHLLQDEYVIGHALNQLGAVAWQRGELASGERYFLDSLENFQTYGNGVMCGTVLRRLGGLYCELGDFDAAFASLRRSLAIFKEIQDEPRCCGALTGLGRLAMAREDEQEAEEFFNQALTLIRRTSNLFNQLNPLEAFSRLLQRQGNLERAYAVTHDALALLEDRDHRAWKARIVDAVASLAARLGLVETAMRLYGAADAHLTPIEALFDPTWEVEREQLLARMRAQMGAASFTAAWAAGAAMTLDEAVELAQSVKLTQKSVSSTV